ncbi:MAG TPA: GMC family oxidoreductase [Rhodospirillales bacterium]|nr:GMC family oxidoreductase [Rhodospirillales bacterium]
MAKHDVIVIGSGAGGAAFAWTLCAHGVDVLLLEAGPSYNPFKDYLLEKETWEQRLFPVKKKPEPTHVFAPMQSLDSRHDALRSWNANNGRMNRGNRRRVHAYHHVQGVGGSTLHFTAEAHRLHPDSMQMRTRYGVSADWPFDYAELEPYYDRIERFVGVAGPNPGLGEDKDRWRSRPYPLPHHPLSYASKMLEAAFRKLDMSLEVNPVAILSQPHNGRPECNYCGNCIRGCPRTDKGSADVTFIAQALGTGKLTLRSRSSVFRLEAGEDDRVKEVLYKDAENQIQRTSARAVVVACGAVLTPRLLLASDGLANESGLVRRNLMETSFWAASGLSDDALGSHRGIPSDGVCWDFTGPGAIPNVIGGCRFTTGAGTVDFLGPISYARRIVSGWGRKHKKGMRAAFGNAVAIGSIGESLPNDKTYVDLDPKKKDSNGVPLARIHSHLDEMEIARLEFMAGRCRDILKAVGNVELIEEYGSYDFFSSTHVFGTCRMGLDPEASVVDPHGRSHRWRNLFIADASVFPSSGGGESPSLTIESLSTRSADFLANLLERREL